MYATVNGARLYFDVLNPALDIVGDAIDEKRALICIPGGPGGDHQALRPAFDRLGAHAQVIYLDPRGSGRSNACGPETWTLDQWGDDVAAFADALGLDKPIVLGVSGGAMVAASYLARRPDHAGGVILVNACARLDKEAVIDGFARVGGQAAGIAARNMYDRGVPEDVGPFFQHCLPLYARRPAPPPVGQRAQFNLAVSHHFFTGGGEAFRFDFRDKLGKTACPVLALAGAHDPITRIEWARELAAALPETHRTYVEFPDASHAIATDAPEAFYDAIERFLSRA